MSLSEVAQKKWVDCADALRDGYVPDSGELPRPLRELFNRCVDEGAADLNSKWGPMLKKKPTPPKTDAATP